MIRALLALGAGLVLAAGPASAADARSATAFAGCGAPPALTVIEPSLTRFGASIERHQPLTVVALGSSSTEGIGASAASLNYPSRLEAELRERLPGVGLHVLNRGKAGEDAAEELARLDRDVVAERPSLVIWQLGTNAVLRHDDPAADGQLIDRGLARLKETGSDVVLMDMQYAPRVLARPAYAVVEQLIADVAKRNHVGLFRRFDIMRHWSAILPADAPPTIGPDGLHMTDYGYGCLAGDLAEALVWNWWSQENPTQRAAMIAALAAPRYSDAATSYPLP